MVGKASAVKISYGILQESSHDLHTDGIYVPFEKVIGNFKFYLQNTKHLVHGNLQRRNSII